LFTRLKALVEYFQPMKNIFLFSLFLIICQYTVMAGDVKQYEFGDQWYPADPQELNSQLDSFFSAANPAKAEGEILGIIAPHAGYVFSGPVAAYGFKAIAGAKPDTVIVMGPSHKYYFTGISVYPDGEFSTPLGNFKIDSAIAKELGVLHFVNFYKHNFSGEHSVEAELPFLKKVLPGVKIVPIVFGDMDYEALSAVAQKLVEISQKHKILVIASSDLSHYLDYNLTNAIDGKTVQLIKDNESEKLWDIRNDANGRACGINDITAFLRYVNLRGGKITILKYLNSGDTSGEKGRVVGYVSALASITAESVKESEGQKMEKFSLSEDDKKTLLRIARETLQSYLVEGKLSKFKTDSKNLNENRGAFVTLTEHGQLRGCIGRMVADEPLYKVISEMAIAAAVNDPRFSAVRSTELKDIEIEISVLTPFAVVKNLDDIKMGTHGLMLRKGFNSGVFLPQVPGEQGWDKKTYLEELGHKAGLSSDAYLDKDATIYSFEAIVFNEKK